MVPNKCECDNCARFRFSNERHFGGQMSKATMTKSKSVSAIAIVTGLCVG